MGSIICLACQDEITDNPVDLPCGEHTYCIDCFRAAVQVAVCDEQYYPLRCHSSEDHHIPDYFIREALSRGTTEAEALLEAFEKKAQEYSTPAALRTYCSNKECVLKLGHSRYIHPPDSGAQDQVECPDCEGFTCCFCKEPITDEPFHFCEGIKQDENIKKIIEALPEEDQWLWKKCWACRVWVEKTDTCNHMTCLWCGIFEAPIYDEDGYNQNDFDPETGLNRDGLEWDPSISHAEDLDDDHDSEFGEDGFDQFGFDEQGYDREGFDRSDFDFDDYDREGYNSSGLDRDGLERDGFDDGYSLWGFNIEGFNREGFDMWGRNWAGRDRNGLAITGRDEDDFFEDGLDMEGFDADGISLSGLHRDYYDDEGHDPFGFDVFGFSRAGYDFEEYDPDGYDFAGFDRHEFDIIGYKADGFDCLGYDHNRRNRQGFRMRGYTLHHRDANRDVEPGYYEAPDGNIRKGSKDDGPKEAVMNCDHNTYTRWAGARCLMCHGDSDQVHHWCDRCGAQFCKWCVNIGVERVREILWDRYVWPCDVSFGTREMFRREMIESNMGEEELFEGELIESAAGDEEGPDVEDTTDKEDAAKEETKDEEDIGWKPEEDGNVGSGRD